MRSGDARLSLAAVKPRSRFVRPVKPLALALECSAPLGSRPVAVFSEPLAPAPLRFAPLRPCVPLVETAHTLEAPWTLAPERPSGWVRLAPAAGVMPDALREASAAPVYTGPRFALKAPHPDYSFGALSAATQFEAPLRVAAAAAYEPHAIGSADARPAAVAAKPHRRFAKSAKPLLSGLECSHPLGRRLAPEFPLPPAPLAAWFASLGRCVPLAGTGHVAEAPLTLAPRRPSGWAPLAPAAAIMPAVAHAAFTAPIAAHAEFAPQALHSDYGFAALAAANRFKTPLCALAEVAPAAASMAATAAWPAQGFLTTCRPEAPALTAAPARPEPAGCGRVFQFAAARVPRGVPRLLGPAPNRKSRTPLAPHLRPTGTAALPLMTRAAGAGPRIRPAIAPPAPVAADPRSPQTGELLMPHAGELPAPLGPRAHFGPVGLAENPFPPSAGVQARGPASPAPTVVLPAAAPIDARDPDLAGLAFLYASQRLATRNWSVRQIQALAATILLAVFLSYGASGIWRMGESPGSLRDAIARRAPIGMEEDFTTGMRAWSGEDLSTWKLHAAGYASPGQLAVYRPSLRLGDYRLEFKAQIDSKSFGWIYRARDRSNYHAAVFRITKQGPALVRYSVLDGKREQPSELPLQSVLQNNSAFLAELIAEGDRFTLLLDGETVDTWTDDRLLEGGVGFFQESGARARLYHVRLTSQDDWIGKLCAFLAPAPAPHTAQLQITEESDNAAVEIRRVHARSPKIQR